MRSLEERFWAKVDKSGDCWLWTGARNPYGRIGIGRHRTVLAHRVAWELMVGPIPDGMKIDHRCRVVACVNPDHLRVVTHKQNLEHQRSDRGASLRRDGRWEARVKHHGKKHFAGLFSTREEALQAAAALRCQLFTHNDEDRKVDE